jgi:outer membrane protein assembly factor BamB
MNQKTLLVAAMLIAGINLFAQRQADWKAELPAPASEIFFHSLTGVPIIKGDDYYAGIDVQTHAVKWTVKRSGMQAVAAVLGNDDGQDFFEVAYTPFAVVNNTLVDTRDGKLLLSKDKDGYSQLFDYEILPDLDAILFRTNADGFVRLHLIDKKTGDKKWSSNVLKGSASLTEKLGATKNGQAPQTFVPEGTTPLLQNNALMVYQFKKEIALVNVADGKSMWVEKLDPARIFFSNDQKTAFMVEHDKGGLIAQALSAGTKRIGKEITAIDVATGKPVWKKPIEADEQIKWFDMQDNKILVVHAKGCNFYNTEDGKKVWKDDYDAKKIAKVEDNTEGYLISFGFQKTMQLDKNGKKLWKKPQVSPAAEDTDVEEDLDYASYKYDNGTLFLYPEKLVFSPLKGGKLKKFSMSITPETKLEYDAGRKTMLIYNKDEISLVNPDKYPKGFLTKEVKTKAADIRFVEMRANNFYFSGEEDFVTINPEGEVIEKHYKEPFDGKAFFASAASIALSVGSAAQNVAGHVNAMKGSTELIGGMASGNENMVAGGEKKLNKAVKQVKTSYMMEDAANFITPQRHTAFSQTRDFAYFFTKDKESKEKVLIKINKDTSLEVDKLILNDARPIYKVDDVENRVLYVDKKEILVFEPKKVKQ